jgi:hypothetical protein
MMFRIVAGLSIAVLTSACSPVTPRQCVDDIEHPDITTDLIRIKASELRVSNGNGQLNPELRAHAVRMLQAVTRPSSKCGGKPVFLTWHSTRSVFENRSTPDKQRLVLGAANQLKAEERRAAERNGPVFVSVLVNEALRQDVVRNRLADLKTITNGRRRGAHGVPEFSRESVAVKAVWRVIPKGGRLPLGLWRLEETRESPAAQSYQWAEPDWKKRATVMWVAPDVPKVCLAREIAGEETSPAPFFSLRYGEDMEFDVRDGEPEPNKGDVLILVGLHVTTKDIPDWFWATSWFTDRQKEASGIKNAPWCNYAVDATVTMYRPLSGKNPVTGTYYEPDELRRHKAIYNPYLEAGHSLGLRSNCMTCHSVAGYCTSDPAAAQHDNRPYTLDELENKMRTDFIWSLGRVASQSSTCSPHSGQ